MEKASFSVEDLDFVSKSLLCIRRIGKALFMACRVVMPSKRARLVF